LGVYKKVLTPGMLRDASFFFIVGLLP